MLRKWELRIKQAGAELYASFDADERRLVQFGLHPYQKTRAVEVEIKKEFLEAEGRPMNTQEGVALARLLAVAVMDAANRGTDPMIA